MGNSTRPALLPFLRHDDIASCRADFEHYRREGFPVYSLKRDDRRQELLEFLVADHAGIIDKQGRIKQTMHGLALAWHYHPLAWTVNSETDYKVFPVPNGDCKGLLRHPQNRGFSRLQIFLYVQASKFARLPDRSHRCAYSYRAADALTSGQNVLRCLRTHQIY